MIDTYLGSYEGRNASGPFVSCGLFQLLRLHPLDKQALNAIVLVPLLVLL